MGGVTQSPAPHENRSRRLGELLYCRREYGLTGNHLAFVRLLALAEPLPVRIGERILPPCFQALASARRFLSVDFRLSILRLPDCVGPVSLVTHAA